MGDEARGEEGREEAGTGPPIRHVIPGNCRDNVGFLALGDLLSSGIRIDLELRYRLDATASFSTCQSWTATPMHCIRSGSGILLEHDTESGHIILFARHKAGGRPDGKI